MLNGKLDQDHGRDSVSPDLGPNCLHLTTKVAASKESVKRVERNRDLYWSSILASLAMKTASNGFLSN